MSSTSVSPEPPLTVLKGKPKAKKGKKKTPSAPQAGRNESDDPTWAYKPPPGVVLLDTSEAHDAGGFDWDTVADDPDLELWLIRVPDAVKPKSLENTTIALTASSKSACVGVIHRKHASFDIWSVGDDNNEHVGGEEIKSISCLLPKNGALYPAPRPIARHFVVAAQAVTPTPDPSTVSASSSLHTNKNPPRQSYPKDLLKHRFLPIGALAGDADAMDVDVDKSPEPEQAPVPSGPEPTHIKRKQKKTKEKVAKVDVDVDVDAGTDGPSENLEPQPTPIPTQTQTKHKKEKREKKDKKGTESLSQVETRVDGTPTNVRAKKRKSLGDKETPVGTTAKKAKKAKA